jgi:hypothetical protein
MSTFTSDSLLIDRWRPPRRRHDFSSDLGIKHAEGGVTGPRAFGDYRPRKL